MTTDMAEFDPTRGDLAGLTAWLVDRVAFYLQVSPEEVSPDARLAEIGLGSVYGLTLSGEIEDALHLEVEPTLAWDHPTINAIAQHLFERLAARQDSAV